MCKRTMNHDHNFFFLFTDLSNSKHSSNRRNGKTISVQPQRVETNRSIGLKKSSNNFKQPQPRVSLFCGKKGSKVCIKFKI